MTQLVLQPCASSKPKAHFRDTIANPVVIAEHLDLLGADAETLRQIAPGEVALWGIVPGNSVRQYEKIDIGDRVLFTAQRTGFFTGTIAAKFHNRELADRLWGNDDEGRTWEFMYAVTDSRYVSITVEDINVLLDYEPNNAVQGLSVPDKGSPALAVELIDSASDADPPTWISNSGRQATRSSTETVKPVETVLLTWNPDVWSPDEPQDLEFKQMIEGTIESEQIVQRWSIGSRRNLDVGTQTFMVRQRRDRGIVASGVVVRGVYDGPHWDGSGRTVSYVDCRWDTIVTIPNRLKIEQLKSEIPLVSWDHLQGSGVIPRVRHFADKEPHDASRIQDLWDRHLRGLGLEVPAISEEIVPDTSEHWEGSVSTVMVNKYERSSSARKKCVDHWGYGCAVCGRTMEEMYGPEGAGRIHVHHLVPISLIGTEYKVDPINDLRPVCPNCHAAIHFGSRHRTIEEAKVMLALNSSMTGWKP
jgi:5-methylcytosine-specific restriction enzyme A